MDIDVEFVIVRLIEGGVCLFEREFFECDVEVDILIQVIRYDGDFLVSF